MALTESQVLSEKINFEFYNEIDLGEQLDHDGQTTFINNDYTDTDIAEILKLRKKLIYGNKTVSIKDLNFFTISSKDSFSNLPTPDPLTWHQSILFTPLNNHSRGSLRKGDILFCNRIGQFTDLNEALDIRGVYGVGIAIEDPQLYFPLKTNHEQYGVKVIFPYSLQRNLPTRKIQLNPATIAQTPYNGNRNDSLQKIDSELIAEELLKMIALENPGFDIFLKIFYDYLLPLSAIEVVNQGASLNSVDLLDEFIKWFYDPENYRKSYEGLVEYDLLISWDNLYFNGNLFKIRFEEIAQSIDRIKETLRNGIQKPKWKSFSQACSKGAPAALLGDNNYLKFLNEFKFHEIVKNPLENNFNKIIYGAPGTGKSQRIVNYFKQNHIGDQYIERVVFHPEMDYHSFVGGYKPISRSVDNVSSISYEYVPQSLLKLILSAIKDPNHNYYLVIEEINRGNCAEIFGDMFQLLDRKPEYKISPSTEMMHYIQDLEKKDSYKYLSNGKLQMPENLILFATMNTSDQSLYPMDSAFKRRWEWEYEPISYPKDVNDLSNDSFSYYIRVNEEIEIQWVHFMKVANNIIKNIPGLGMDKCLGNFFIKPITGSKIDGAEFVNKVIFYLWNDVLKDEINTLFNKYQFEDFLPYDTDGIQRLKEFIQTHGNLYKH